MNLQLKNFGINSGSRKEVKEILKVTILKSIKNRKLDLLKLDFEELSNEALKELYVIKYTNSRDLNLNKIRSLITILIMKII